MNRYLSIALILFGLSYWFIPSHDPDLGWHLLGGAWITAHGKVPDSDFINAFNSNWLDYHWLAQVLFYQVFLKLGYDGLRLLLGASMALIALFVLLICKRRAPHASALVFALIGFSHLYLIGQIASIRPQQFSILGLAAALFILLKKKSKYELIPLLFLSVTLANVHVYWIFIPFLWFCYRCLPRFYRSEKSRSCALKAWGGFLLLSASGLASPYFYLNYFVIFDYGLMSEELRLSINEFKSVFAASGLTPWILLVEIALVAWRMRSKQRVLVRLPDYLIAIVGLILAARALKFVALCSIFSLPIVCTSLQFCCRPKNKQVGCSACCPWTSTRGLSLLTLLFCALCAYNTFPLKAANQAENDRYLSDSLPLDACSALPSLPISKAPVHDHIRILTFFDYGGWCSWQIYQKLGDNDFRVTTDGRTQLVPPEHYKLSFDLFRVNYDWEKTLKLWDPDVVLAEKGRALGEVLHLAPANWKMIFESQKFALFVPVR